MKFSLGWLLEKILQVFINQAVFRILINSAEYIIFNHRIDFIVINCDFSHCQIKKKNI